ncbi:unnamed protein product [Arctia plantaginis]|uniref:Chemosensory protein n=1 Tax=Arctia plantaginis TaxID=874455 RepID=A0A8S0ZGY3_ARCPL|nr:unnamed protein product [Arctia plantaginis]
MNWTHHQITRFIFFVRCSSALIREHVATQQRPHEIHCSNLHVAETLKNEKLYIAFLKCILELGKCTAEGRELKSHITDALENECAKCTEKQKDGVKYVMKHMIKYKVDDWKKLTDKYDPENKYRTKYENQLREVEA